MQWFLHKKEKLIGGFTLVEMLVYVAILSIVLGAALTAIFSFSDHIGKSRANRLVTVAAETALERILTETRMANAVDVAGSNLGSSPGTLTLTRDDGTTMFFELSGGTLDVSENGVNQGPLTPGGVEVENLEFRRFDNSFTELIAIDITLTALSGGASSTRSFSAAAVLRGSYE